MHFVFSASNTAAIAVYSDFCGLEIFVLEINNPGHVSCLTKSMLLKSRFQHPTKNVLARINDHFRLSKKLLIIFINKFLLFK